MDKETLVLLVNVVTMVFVAVLGFFVRDIQARLMRVEDLFMKVPGK